ncbi:DNA alkylation repair protein [Brumimicrobium mesophilum]|uniref:DNA alkylation repair protein n=1 Tax=Brumimicrobium mesophilum TaxID=392717 RepID=UPI000D140FDD|nr:DNA alkylation repair protein [Brumimicrobium mesophilum]
MAYKKLKLWFDQELAELLADKIIALYPIFNKSSFVKAINQKISNLELKDRIAIIADELGNHLTTDYDTNARILTQILGPENEEETGMFTNFYWIMPIAKYVEKYGLNHFETSMHLIEEITKRNTGEYAIRSFIEAYPQKTMNKMFEWSTNSNKHIRRLASEGGRPRLPWAPKLDLFIEDPSPLLPILNNLKDDQSKYVQKSVANCINDILKDNKEIGLQLIESWKEENMSKERKWIIKHALRNLIKNGEIKNG